MANPDTESQTIGDRLLQALADERLSLREFAEKSEIPYRSLQAYVSDRQKPGADAVIRICETLDVTTDWLLTGTRSFRIQLVGGLRMRPSGKDLNNLLDWLNQFEDPEEFVTGALAVGKLIGNSIYNARRWVRIFDRLKTAQQEGKLSGINVDELTSDEAYKHYVREFGKPDF